jgi:hypothetical protein
MRDRLQSRRKTLTLVRDVEISSGLSLSLEWVAEEERVTEWISGDSDLEKGRRLMQRIKERGWVSGEGH